MVAHPEALYKARRVNEAIRALVLAIPADDFSVRKEDTEGYASLLRKMDPILRNYDEGVRVSVMHNFDQTQFRRQLYPSKRAQGWRVRVVKDHVTDGGPGVDQS